MTASKFFPGVTVSMTCYQETCVGIYMTVRLGDEFTPVYSFTGAGRFHWPVGTLVRGFDLKPYQSCPNCKTLFASVIVEWNGPVIPPTIFGYDPEPA